MVQMVQSRLIGALQLVFSFIRSVADKAGISLAQAKVVLSVQRSLLLAFEDDPAFSLGDSAKFLQFMEASYNNMMESVGTSGSRRLAQARLLPFASVLGEATALATASTAADSAISSKQAAVAEAVRAGRELVQSELEAVAVATAQVAALQSTQMVAATQALVAGTTTPDAFGKM